ncbi:uncharacterized protein LOC119073416 [Bradysia coprophila]|uniref:uncharacterized protein LOC119073416 n=1 Tax=Bradysia coprophila TaxID=38358 RepID=UPI00187DBEE5|nr:uncharacterized protein LOC119073416 [Bradysia coprophila]
MLAVFVLSLVTFVRGNNFKNILSSRVHTYLRDQYKDNPTKCECMIEYFRLINIWEKFYSEDILGEQRNLVRDLRPYIEDADGKCTVVAFYESPWGIFVTVLAVIFAAVIAIFIYPRNKRKKNNKSVKSAQRSKFRKPKPPKPKQMLYYQLTL